MKNTRVFRCRVVLSSRSVTVELNISLRQTYGGKVKLSVLAKIF